MNQQATNNLFKALEDDDFLTFSKAVKTEIDRKVKEHPMTVKQQDEYQRYKSIEDLYAKVSLASADTSSEPQNAE